MTKKPHPEEDIDLPPPGQRRFAMLAGIIILAVILAFLAWFIITHTEMREPGGSIVGLANFSGFFLPAQLL
ncbi:MAG TPA: hypothetical protein VFI91_05305 [Longimicrobiaceae bacterium]|nr:hypothetical protein [Longimicrobiaceae bacterium]